MGGGRGKARKIKRRNGEERESRPVQMKVKKLQNIVPGGRGLNPDWLFLRTADYILLLRLQISVLQTLSQLHIP